MQIVRPTEELADAGLLACVVSLFPLYAKTSSSPCRIYLTESADQSGRIEGSPMSVMSQQRTDCLPDAPRRCLLALQGAGQPQQAA